MNFIEILSRIFNLLLYPAKEWETIATENKPRKTIFARFVVPLFCLITVAVIVGTWLDTSREVYSPGYVIFRISLLWCSLGSGLFVSSFVITEIAARQAGSRDHGRIFALFTYSSGSAGLVIMMVKLFPFFNELLVLAFYSCYLYWRGIPYMIRVEGQNRSIFAILSFIISAATFSLMFFFFGNVLSAVFGLK